MDVVIIFSSRDDDAHLVFRVEQFSFFPRIPEVPISTSSGLDITIEDNGNSFNLLSKEYPLLDVHMIPFIDKTSTFAFHSCVLSSYYRYAKFVNCFFRVAGVVRYDETNIRNIDNLKSMMRDGVLLSDDMFTSYLHYDRNLYGQVTWSIDGI